MSHTCYVVITGIHIVHVHHNYCEHLNVTSGFPASQQLTYGYMLHVNCSTAPAIVSIVTVYIAAGIQIL